MLRIEEKLDYIITKLNGITGINGLGNNLLANILGNAIVGK